MTIKKRDSSMDMTQGSPFRLIILFSLPLIAGNVLQQLYNMVDSMVVGKFVGPTALAAVGAAFPVVFMLSSLFMGLGMGAVVIVSQYYGGGERENLRRTVDTVYTTLLVGGVPLSVLGVLLVNPILNMLGVPHDARQEAFVYLVIVVGGLIGSLGYNFNAGLLQGIGDSRTPLLFLAIACGLNIVLDLLLVLVIPLGVAGVAIATVAAQLFSWIFGIVYINRRYPEMTIRPFSFKFDKRIFWQIVRLGLPAGIQQALFSLATILMGRLVNSYGSAYAAGFSAANKLDTFAFFPIQSVANAATTYTGQNIGAGRLDRVRTGTRSAMLLAVIFGLAGLLVIPAGPALLQMFTSEADVIASGMAYINRIMPFYTMLSFLFIVNGAMRGGGESIIPMLSSLLSMWLARVPAAYLLAHFFGRDNMHFCYAFGWAVGLLVSVPYYISGRWKTKSVTRAGSNAEAAAFARAEQGEDDSAPPPQ